MGLLDNGAVVIMVFPIEWYFDVFWWYTFYPICKKTPIPFRISLVDRLILFLKSVVPGATIQVRRRRDHWANSAILCVEETNFRLTTLHQNSYLFDSICADLLISTLCLCTRTTGRYLEIYCRYWMLLKHLKIWGWAKSARWASK